MIAPALRLVAAVANGARLVTRPRSGVVHLYTGPLSPSGQHAAAAGRTVCRQRTRRLTVLEPASLGLEQMTRTGRRVCRRCMPLLPAVLGRADARDLVRLDDWAATYQHVSPADFALAGRWARTVDEAHQLAMVAGLVHGPKPSTPPARRSPAEVELAAMHDAIQGRRRQLANAGRTPEEIEAAQRARDNEARDSARLIQARQQAIAIDRALTRRTRSQYLTPRERDLLDSA